MSTIQDAKQALLAKRLQNRRNSTQETIDRRPETGPTPLSFAQQRLWLLDQLMPGDPLYNVLYAYRLQGHVNAQALEHSLQEIVRRHDILRTAFQEIDDRPVQVIETESKFNLTVTEFPELPESEREAHALRLASDEFQLSFALTEGHLLRGTLIRLGEHDHVLVLTLHHIIFDGWSRSLFMQELAALYAAFAKGQPSPLAELPIQYADFAHWQRNWLQGDVLDRQLNYWKEKLSGSLTALQLPTDRPRPPVQTTRGTLYRHEMSLSLLEQLKGLSDREGATLFMTLLAAFKTLLFRYSGEPDVLIGSTIAGRNRREIEGLLGFFVNTLVLRSDLSDAPSFRELLKRVRETALEAFTHQDLPFEKLVEELQPERDMSRTPIFQVMFQVVAEGEPHLSGLTVKSLEIEHTIAKFDITLTVQERADGLASIIEYNTDLYNESTIARLAGHFQTLLESIVASPDERIVSLPLLTSAERQLLLVEWNDTAVAFPEHLCLHQLFEEQALRTPDSAAAIYGDEELTYAELDRRANQLARHLLALGVGPDVPVGVCLDRSLELVVALVGILKAGGAYLPLDMEAPPARLAQVIDDADAPVCLAQERWREKLPVDATTCVFLDTDWSVIAERSNDQVTSGVTPDHLVSIYYTSGSTGKPKGVASTHRGWVNRMFWMQRYHGMQAGETALQKTTLTFDDAAVEFFWPLMVGGRIALIEPGLHRDPRAILDGAIRYQATLLQFVPSMLSMVLDTITPEDRTQLDCVRVVVSSGEALRADVVRQFLDKMPGHLHNSWGATEVSIDSTVRTCTEQDVLDGEIVSVGRPIDNNQVYVLDAQLQPVPVGVAGDLYLAGVGLAREYLKNEEKTREAFIANPFVPHTRMYKTGDCGYYRPDGSIKFMGRQDNQVKIRGIRVELGEIESVLGQHPSVNNVVVIAHEDTPGVKRLFAYIVSSVEPTPSVLEIRAFLKERLPDFMMPTAITWLDKMPLNANGKIDTFALPVPEVTRDDLDAQYVAPRTPVEEAVAMIWSEVLSIEQIGVHDNFFDLGGHSLLATQVVSRIRRTLLIEFPLRSLFEKPTIAELSEEVEAALMQMLESLSEEEALERLE